ncbi:MAG TPA: radical SAM family heme chaperone HemW [Limnochordales bacterium]
MRPARRALLVQAVQQAARWPAGLYVHIPYCSSVCPYCDFNVYPVRSRAELATMVRAILQEAAAWAQLLRGAAGGFSTVYLGGGTPSLLPPEDLRCLVEGLRELLPLEGAQEWSLEANPGTLTPRRVQAWKQAGITRVSLGVQSFHQEELLRLGRQHGPRQVQRSLKLLREAGWQNVNLDLMFGLPGQRLRDWQASLEQAVASGVPHVSVYGLTLHPGTPFYDRWKAGQLEVAGESAQARMYRRAVEVLRAAELYRYEVSNFCRPGWECRHHLNYWNCGEYLGLGPGAHSHWAGWRFANRRHPAVYRVAAAAGQPALTVAWAEQLTCQQQRDEFILLGLRLARGVDRQEFYRRFGLWPEQAYDGRAWERMAALGLVHLHRRNWWRLTDRGFLLADAVAREILAAARQVVVP